MARLTLTPVALKTSAVIGRVPLDSVPEDVRADVEDAWEYFTGDGKDMETQLSVTFNSKAHKVRWTAQAKTYCEHRHDATGKPNLYLRVSPTRGIPDEEMRFRIKLAADVEKNTKDTTEIRKATKTAKAAAAKGDLASVK